MDKTKISHSETVKVDEPKSILRNRNEHSPIKKPNKRHHKSALMNMNTITSSNKTYILEPECKSKPCHVVSSPSFKSFKEYTYLEESNIKFDKQWKIVLKYMILSTMILIRAIFLFLMDMEEMK